MPFASLKEEVDAFDYWYHRIELTPDVTTPGWAPVDKAAYGIPDRLDGKRVLDVGAWDGFWTFEALKRGAAEVVAIDDFSDHVGEHVKRTAWDTFDLCRRVLGYSDTVCKRQEMTVYDVSPETLGMFDVVFCFGTLYHLRYPLLGLDKLSAVCKEDIFVESAILDDYSPYRGGLNQGYPGKQMVMEFYPGTNYGNNESNWWAPTMNCLGNMVAAAGFSNISAWKLAIEPKGVGECRGFVSGSKIGSINPPPV
jgi:tRNA (mo5U34)-methyltransferase